MTDTPVAEVQVGDFIDTYCGYGEVTAIYDMADTGLAHFENWLGLFVNLHNPQTDRSQEFDTPVSYRKDWTVKNWSR